MPRGNGSGSKKPENRQKGRSSKGFNGSKIAFTSGLGVSAQGIGVRDRGLPSNQKAPTFSKKAAVNPRDIVQLEEEVAALRQGDQLVKKDWRFLL